MNKGKKDASVRTMYALHVLRTRIRVIGIYFAFAFLVVAARLVELGWQHAAYFLFTVSTIGILAVSEVFFYFLLRHKKVDIFRLARIQLTTISQEIAAAGTRQSVRAVVLFSIANATITSWWPRHDLYVTTIASWVSFISLCIIVSVCFSNLAVWIRVIWGYYGFNPDEAADIAIYLMSRRIDTSNHHDDSRKIMASCHEKSSVANTKSTVGATT